MKISEYSSAIKSNNDIEVIDILESLPTLLYEFKMNEKEYSKDSYSYKKKVYPLFDKEVVDDESNNKLLSTIANKIPYYYIEPTSVIYSDSSGSPQDYILQDTRDCGINNVPSPLQVSDFWQTWFRDTWGYIQNSLILEIYNKLQYPYVNENLFLNNSLFSKLAEEGFNSSTESGTYIGFIDTEEENNEVYDPSYEFYGEETGCLDHVDDIINQKILSEYFLIDYKDTSTMLLSKWGESLFASGQIDSEELDSAKTLFKLQDIKNEFIRRKLAGSRTLYQLVVDSIDRKGSFILAVKESELKNSENNTYNSLRLFKVISMPGINTKYLSYSSESTTYGSLIDTYCFKSGDLPLNTLVPIFYSSNDIVYNNSIVNYDTESFFKPESNSSIETYRMKFLRDNLNALDWNNLKGINLADNIADAYDILDLVEYVDDQKVYKNVLDREESFLELDAKTAKININYATNSVLDISADRVLYHRNTLQQLLGENYPYVTYPIADYNGLSLMDTYWLDYVEREIKTKSKVQDATKVGTQVNSVHELYSDKVLLDYDFFAISYTNKNYIEDPVNNTFDSLEIRDYQDGDRYALLWYCSLRYYYGDSTINKKTYKLIKHLVCVISLAENFDKEQTLKYQDSQYDIYNYFNNGILPLTYNDAVDEYLWKNYSGYYIDAETNSYDFVDNLKDLGYAQAMFLFSSIDNMRADSKYKQEITDYLSTSVRNPIYYNSNDYGTFCSKLPLKNDTQAVYYVVKKLKDQSDNTYEYFWSDPIHIISLAKLLGKDGIDSFEDEIKLDEKKVYEDDTNQLRCYYNMYLNYMDESASPLRHKTLYLRDNTLDTEGTGPKKTARLCSLVVDDTDSTWLCNDTGSTTVKSSSNVYGYYLQKFNQYTKTEGSDSNYDYSCSYIEGDNKIAEKLYIGETSNSSNSTNNTVEEESTYSIYTDINGIYALSIYPYYRKFNNEAIDKNKDMFIGKLQCYNIEPYANAHNVTSAVNWDWNKSTEKSIFLEFSFSNFNGKLEVLFGESSMADRLAELNKLTADTTESNKICSKLFFVKDSDSDKMTLYTYEVLEKKFVEHSMYLISYDEFSLYITPNGVVILDCGDLGKLEYDSIWSYDSWNINTTYKVGISLSDSKIALGVNDFYAYQTVTESPVKTFTKNYIPLFRKDDTVANTTNTLFYGNIYNIRIYNSALDNRQEMMFRNSGTFREIYSFAPSVYKLAYTMYKDIVIFKETSPYEIDGGSLSFLFPAITTLRLFNRGVWDSILLDMKPSPNFEGAYDPVTDTDIYIKNGDTYSLNDCIEQEMLLGDEIGEYIRNINPQYYSDAGYNALNIIYKDTDNPIALVQDDKLAIINTMIEPNNYANTKITSSSDITFLFNSSSNYAYQRILETSSEEDQYIMIPKSIDSSDDSFSYATDINFNLKISPTFDASKWLSKGSNIDLVCVAQDEEDEEPLIVSTLQDDSILSSTKNNIVMPLVIPYQTVSSNVSTANTERIYLDRFYYNNVIISSYFATFLNASNYYSEIKLPVAIEYTTTEYVEHCGGRLTATTDNIPKSERIYYYINNEIKDAIEYTPIDNSLVFEQVGEEVDVDNDIQITTGKMERGKTYYRRDENYSYIKGSSFTIKKDYGTNGYYFTKQLDSTGNACFIPWTENELDTKTSYYAGWKVMNEFNGSSFTSGVTYYEDIITPNTYYYKQNDGSYEIFSDETYYHKLTVTLYEKITVNHLEYVNKWNALRTLKEGTYYFTCKYPIQIMPFMDNEFDGDSSNIYTTYYASTRFKVEAKCNLYLDTSDSYTVTGTPRNYMSDKYVATVEDSSNRLQPDDNRTFPHMKVSIDLYVLDCNKVAGRMTSGNTEDYTFSWKKVASNYDTSEGVTLLNKEAITGNLMLSQNIPMFLEKSYTSSFFIAQRQKNSDGSVITTVPGSADDDIVEPIKILLNYNNQSAENLKSITEEDMDKQVLIAGKSYKILFDYTAKVSEISYTDNFYEGSTLSDSEKVNYSRLVNLLDTDFLNVKDYMYDSSGRAFVSAGNYFLTSKASGFQVQKVNSTYSWVAYSTGTYGGSNSSIFPLGNPYSRSSNLNYILSRKVDDTNNKIDGRENINNSYAYPYMVTDNLHGRIVEGYPTSIGAITKNGRYATLTIDESAIMKKQYDHVKSIVTTAITSLKSKATGLFNGLSRITPNFQYMASDTSTIRTDNINKEIYLDSEDCAFFGYYSSSRKIPLGNSNLTIKRNSLYSNNLLKNSTFDNSTFWILNDGVNDSSYFTKTWVADNTWNNGEGKDVFEITNKALTTTKLKYNGGSVGLNSQFETAINIKVLSGKISKVQATLSYNGKEITTLDMVASFSDNDWFNYSASTSSAVSCDSITYLITFSEKSSRIQLTKAVVRKCNTISHKSGLYDALNEANLNSRSTYVSVNGHSMVLLKYPDTKDSRTLIRLYPNEYFPIQFNNTYLKTVGGNAKTVYRPKSGTYRIGEFINTNRMYARDTEGSRLTELINPFIRRLCINVKGGDVSVDIHKYGMFKDTFGNLSREEMQGNIFDVIEKMTSSDVSISRSEEGDQFRIALTRVPIALNSSKEFEAFNLNIGLNESSPFKLANETFSVLFNSFNPDNYRKGINTPIVVTNAQFIYRENDSKRIIYEIEFLPVIYSELRNHISLNILMYKKAYNTDD